MIASILMFPKMKRVNAAFQKNGKKQKNGTIIDNKRCYIIQDLYFTKNIDLNNCLNDKLENENLEQIYNLNVTVSYKNYDTFNFIGKSGSPPPLQTSPQSSLNSLTSVPSIDETDMESIMPTSSYKIIHTYKIPPITDEHKDKESETIHNTKSKTWIIIISIIGGIIFLAIIGLIIYSIKKEIKNQNLIGIILHPLIFLNLDHYMYKTI